MTEKQDIAHTREDGSVQTLKEHSEGVAHLAADFAAAFGMSEWGALLGLLHDKGKERKSFQRYIKHDNWHGEDKRHAFVGALIAKLMCPEVAPLLSFAIMGHHSGLPDFDDRHFTLPLPSEIAVPSEKVRLTFPKEMTRAIQNPEMLRRDLHHVVRMLYSCLVDADWLDTERFMNRETADLRRRSPAKMEDLKVRLDSFLVRLTASAPDTQVNRLRAEVQGWCREKAQQGRGFFSLTVPTGGGKTLSSLVWAIHHAIQNGQRRIVIAIPFTTIVTQTAALLKKVFGEENVLEHHSDQNYESISDETLRRRMKLATENWESPIVITTNVQLFESMLAARSSACRKLHNLANSVLILDEVQSLPLNHLQPVVDSLSTYVRLFGVSVLFTTASLPVLDHAAGFGLRGIDEIHEIVPDPVSLHAVLRRCTIEVERDACDAESLAARLASHDKVLCIVNTRADARKVYEHLPKEGITIHLSRMMCSEHLREQIETLKLALSDPQKVVRVVATQLIEAGVDIDFPVVYRAEAGLDSILQAAGRCNREGRSKLGRTIVYRFHKMPYGAVRRACYATASLPADADLQSPATMSQYFKQLYSRCTTFDASDIAGRLYTAPGDWCFKSAAADFHLIDDGGMRTVYVNFGSCPALIQQLLQDGVSGMLMRRLATYGVHVHPRDFETLVDNGMVEEVVEGIWWVPDAAHYRSDVGLVTESHWQEEILMI